MKIFLAKQARWIVFATVTLASINMQPLFAKSSGEKSQSTHWLARLKQEIQETWQKDGGNMKGEIKFVYGNNIWQPGQQYTSSEEWLALTCGVQGCSLEAAKLNIKKESWQGHYDDEATMGQNLRFGLTAKSNAKPIAWFSTGSAQTWLRSGAVATYYSGIGHTKATGKGTLEVVIKLPSGDTASLVPMLLSAKWSPKLLEEFNPGNDSSTFLLQLRSGGKRQFFLGELGTCSHMVNAPHYLLWAGDLDGDGKPDYLINFIDADGPVQLYLSSAAKSGQLVGLVGTHISPPHGGECDGGEPEM